MKLSKKNVNELLDLLEVEKNSRLMKAIIEVFEHAEYDEKEKVL